MPPHLIVEVGSRDGLDAITLQEEFGCQVIAFEPNPESFLLCNNNILVSGNPMVSLRKEALTNSNGSISFWAIDPLKYENDGASSLFKINFLNRHVDDVDYLRDSVQKEVIVDGARYDSLGIETPQLIALDVEGAELQVLQGFGEEINKIGFIILEMAPVSHHFGGANFRQLHEFLKNHGFRYRASDEYGAGNCRLFFGLIRTWRYSKMQNPFSKPKARGFFNAIYENRKYS